MKLKRKLLSCCHSSIINLPIFHLKTLTISFQLKPHNYLVKTASHPFLHHTLLLGRSLMQTDEENFSGKGMPPIRYQVGNGYMNCGPVAPDLGPNVPLDADYCRHFHGFEFQPSEVYPKHFIIFDQTNNRSQIMYTPALTQNFTCPYPSIDVHATFLHGDSAGKDVYVKNNEPSSYLKEDTKDIDLLMSLEEELEEDDEVISTARTFGNYDDCSSADSCSSSRKPGASSAKKSFSRCSGINNDSERQRQRMKKMVKALRQIVPGADKMTTADLIDEAVTYLKSLKAEAKKLGIGNLTK